MIRKPIAYSFIMIASFILLAHDIVPHHHYEADIAFELFHKNSSKSEKDHNLPFPEHAHQHTDYLAVFRQVFSYSAHTGRLLDRDDVCPESNLIDCLFLFSLNSFCIYYPPARLSVFCGASSLLPDIQSYTFGLRAPPVV